MKYCMLCFSTGRIFNIFDNYGNAEHTIKDDLIEFFGEHVLGFLQPNDSLCSRCMNALENVAYIKRFFTPIVCRYNRNDGDKKPLYFGKLWELFGTMKFEITPEAEMLSSSLIPNNSDGMIPYCTPTTSHTTASTNSSPSCGSTTNLLVHSHSIPYDPDFEKFIEDRERFRSLSRTSHTSSKSGNTEVAKIMSGRKRKKRGKYDRPHTVGAYEDIYDYTYRKRYKTARQPFRKRSLYNEDGVLNRKRTRSVSRLEEEESINLTRYMSTIIRCPESGCDKVFRDVDQFTLHSLYDHNNLVLYSCDQCDFRYTNKCYLKDHQIESHDQFMYNCFMCGVEVFTSANLQIHLQNHLAYSVPCNYCDKFFLSREMCQRHTLEKHRGKQQRIRPKKIRILDRIDKSEDEDEDENEEENAEEMVNLGRISPPNIIMIQSGRMSASDFVRRHLSEELDFASVNVDSDTD